MSGNIRARVLWLARLTGAPSWRGHTGGSVLARARRWCGTTILRRTGEQCDACGRPVGCAWWVEDAGRWRKVYAHLMGSEPAKTPWGVSGGLLCPGCFARGAAGLGVSVLCSLGHAHSQGDVMSTTALTTEEAQELAKRWAWWRDGAGIDKEKPPRGAGEAVNLAWIQRMADMCVTTEDWAKLATWVQGEVEARLASSPTVEPQHMAAEHIHEMLGLPEDDDLDVAWELCAAAKAKGWA